MDNENLLESIIDWQKFDATVDLSERLKGVTLSHVEQEVRLWQSQIKFMSPIDSKKIKAEIGQWDISIPNLSNFDVVASTYTRLVAYKVRVSQLMSEVNAWTDTCENAIKYIEDLASGAYTGTAADKKSCAKHVVQPFVHLRNETSKLENYLDKMHSCILFCAQQLDLLIKEKQSRAKMNHKLAHDGEIALSNHASDYASDHASEEKPDGEVFKLTKSKRY